MCRTTILSCGRSLEPVPAPGIQVHPLCGAGLAECMKRDDPTRREPTTPDDFDSPWKILLDRWAQPFLEFFFPVAAADIDWSQGLEFLDKELQKITRRSAPGFKGGRHEVDKHWRPGVSVCSTPRPSKLYSAPDVFFLAGPGMRPFPHGVFTVYAVDHAARRPADSPPA